MNASGVAFLVFTAVNIAAISSVSAQSCCTCNLQFNSIQVVDQLVEAKMKSILTNEPCKLQYQ